MEKLQLLKESYDILIFVYIAWTVYITIIPAAKYDVARNKTTPNYKPNFTLFQQILMKTFCRNPAWKLKLIFYLLLRKGLTEWMP